MSTRIAYLTPERLAQEAPIWIDPVGGFGDILMLSTALKKAHETYGKKFHISRRTNYTQFFIGHPAVAEIIGVGLTLTTSIVKLYLSYSRFLR